jgi:hypothetical protein
MLNYVSQSCLVYLTVLTQLLRLCSVELEISVMMCSEMVNYVGESVVDNTSYGILVRVQRKTIGHVVQDSASMIEILTGINLI